MRLKSVLCDTKGRGAHRLPLLGVLSLVLASCASVFDAEPDCRMGVALNFVYDYHMEPGADAFASNVDCVTVLVFDAETGAFVKQLTETTEVLEDPGYRMELLLDTGSYHLVVYGGLACEDARFDLTPEFPVTRSGEMRKEDILVSLPSEDGVSKTQLHNIEERWGGLFYGTKDIVLTDQDLSVQFREETVYLMKDTNNIQVILQELSYPYQIDYRNYDIKIIDDNFVLDGYNNVVPTAADGIQPVYMPYASENRIMGFVEPGERNGQAVEEDEDRPVQVACVEFSTSRLFLEHIETAKLVVTSKTEVDTNGDPLQIINIPLIKYLTAIRGFGDSWIKDDQEFLDRQSRWTLMFFLQHDVWMSARVSVNWWTVRINDIELDY